MAQFFYKALKPDGSLTTGELAANDRTEAFQRLDRQGLQLVSLDVGGVAGVAGNGGAAVEPKSGGSRWSFGKQKGSEAEAREAAEEPAGPVKLKRAEVVLFTEELSDLLAAGLQLEPALRIMESREEKSGLKTVVRILRDRVRDGISFSNALRQASPSFGDLYCNLAAAGEVSGALPTILRRQADYLVTMQDLQSKVLFALIYPSFLVGSGIMVAVLFVTFLIPKLVKLIETTGGTLPAGAKFVIGMTDFLATFWWLIVMLIVIAVLLFRWAIRSEQYRPVWDQQKLKLPMFGNILQTRFFVQFLETLANLIHNGLPLLRGLELARNATTNIYLKALVDKVVDYVAEGGALSRGLKRVGFFPPLLLDMVAVGEQTGDISQSLQRASERYDKELAKNIEKIGALIQPLVIMLMALIVGVMAYFMITVIFETISSVRSRSL